MNNQVAVNASEVEQIAQSFQKLGTTINSVVSEKVKTGFKGLTECNLFNAGIETIVSNADLISNSLNGVYTSIKSHLDSIISLENNNTNLLSGYTGGSYGGGSYSGGSLGGVLTAPTTENLPTITSDAVVINLEKTGKESFSNLVHNIGILKGKMSFDDILFNQEMKKELFKILKEQLKLEGNFNDEDINKIKIAFINKMFNNELDIKELKTETAYILKEFLINHAKENNITVGDLLVNPKYSDMYKKLLQDIYDGGITNNKITSDEYEKIKEYISKKFEEMNKNNISPKISYNA